MKKAIPKLSLEGFVTDKNLQMSQLYELFLASEYSQSNEFNGYITSLKYLIAQYDVRTNLKDKVKTALKAFYFKIIRIIIDNC